MRKTMKSPLLLLALPFLLQSCGDGLQDPAKIVVATPAAIASGAEVILDASDVTGSCPGSLTWSDSSGNANDGILECNGGGSVAATPARVVFDGATTHVRTTIDGNAADMPAATWMAWVKPVSAASSHVLSIDGNTGQFNRALVLDNGAGDVFGVLNPDSAGFWSALGADLNQWQFVVVEFTASDLALQKNASRTSYGSAPAYNNTSVDFTVGSSGDRANLFFNGEIGWVAVYPRILTATEIRQTCLKLVARYSGATCN